MIAGRPLGVCIVGSVELRIFFWNGLRPLFELPGAPPDIICRLTGLRATAVPDSRIPFFLPLIDVVILQGGIPYTLDQ